MSAIFHSTTDADGIATIAWDLPDATMNRLTLEGIAELETHVEAALADPAVRGVILTSAKPDFAGGMDLSVLGRIAGAGAADPAAIHGFVMRLHRLLRRIETGGAEPGSPGKPFVWASPGTAVGIGLEIGLACHHRVAADRPDARIGLPEIRVGLFPGSGGTMRLVRMLGLMGAAPWLLEGKTPDPQRARAAGLIDAVVPADELLPAARAWIAAAGPQDTVKPWDAKGFRIPGGAPFSGEGFETFLGAAAMAHARSQGVYPAVRGLMQAAYEGALVPFDRALEIEARHFTAVLRDPSASAMIRTLFLGKQALEKGAARPALPPAPVARLGVIGAGMMGAGIAQVAAQAGIPVVLLDRDAESAERGRARIAAALDRAVARRHATAGERDATLARIGTAADHAALAGCDLVIEAVFEDPALKHRVLASAAVAMDPGAVLATNTSTLPVGELAAACPDPARFLGIHFFSPVDRMLLVEVIRGPGTADPAVAKALDFVRQLRKTPIVVGDARFFYANRCIIPYINEGLTLVTEGVAPALIENAARQMGMPVGPLQLVDETSLELGLSIQRATAAALGAAHVRSGADELLEEMVERQGRPGRKGGAGLYDYDAGGRRTGLWPGLGRLWPRAADQPGREAVQARLQMVQALEAVRALEEGVLAEPRSGDVGAVLGWGFMPWSGGPFSWLDMLGAARAEALAGRLAAAHGPRFAPPDLLARMAAEGARFYPAATASAAA